MLPAVIILVGFFAVDRHNQQQPLIQPRFRQQQQQNIWPAGGCNDPGLKKDGTDGCFGGERCYYLAQSNPRPKNPETATASSVKTQPACLPTNSATDNGFVMNKGVCKPRDQCDDTSTSPGNGATGCNSLAANILCCSLTSCLLNDDLDNLKYPATITKTELASWPQHKHGICRSNDVCKKLGYVSTSDVIYAGSATGCRHLPDEMRCCTPQPTPDSPKPEPKPKPVDPPPDSPKPGTPDSPKPGTPDSPKPGTPDSPKPGTPDSPKPEPQGPCGLAKCADAVLGCMDICQKGIKGCVVCLDEAGPESECCPCLKEKLPKVGAFVCASERCAKCARSVLDLCDTVCKPKDVTSSVKAAACARCVMAKNDGCCLCIKKFYPRVPSTVCNLKTDEIEKIVPAEIEKIVPADCQKCGKSQAACTAACVTTASASPAKCAKCILTIESDDCCTCIKQAAAQAGTKMPFKCPFPPECDACGDMIEKCFPQCSPPFTPLRAMPCARCIASCPDNKKCCPCIDKMTGTSVCGSAEKLANNVGKDLKDAKNVAKDLKEGGAEGLEIANGMKKNIQVQKGG